MLLGIWFLTFQDNKSFNFKGHKATSMKNKHFIFTTCDMTLHLQVKRKYDGSKIILKYKQAVICNIKHNTHTIPYVWVASEIFMLVSLLHALFYLIVPSQRQQRTKVLVAAQYSYSTSEIWITKHNRNMDHKA